MMKVMKFRTGDEIPPRARHLESVEETFSNPHGSDLNRGGAYSWLDPEGNSRNADAVYRQTYHYFMVECDPDGTITAWRNRAPTFRGVGGSDGISPMDIGTYRDSGTPGTVGYARNSTAINDATLSVADTTNDGPRIDAPHDMERRSRAFWHSELRQSNGRVSARGGVSGRGSLSGGPDVFVQDGDELALRATTNDALSESNLATMEDPTRSFVSEDGVPLPAQGGGRFA